jgi:hypothetical protein
VLASKRSLAGWTEMTTRGQAAFVQSARISRKQGFLSYPLPSRYRYIRVSRTSGFPERRTNFREGPFELDFGHL